MSCESCNSGCESRNTCRGCNSCQSCNANCNNSNGCDAVQNFCRSNQRVGSFSFNACLDSGQFMISKSTWNTLFSYINDAYDKGSKQDGGSSGIPSSDPNTFMTADMFNKVSAALGGLGSTGPSRRVKGATASDPGDLIYGSYFEDLQTYANSLKYKTTQCDNCNVACDTCNGCQKCNSGNCDSCNGNCQSHSQQSCDSSS